MLDLRSENGKKTIKFYFQRGVGGSHNRTTSSVVRIMIPLERCRSRKRHTQHFKGALSEKRATPLTNPFGDKRRKENDTQTSILLGIPKSARCVQEVDDSRICNSHYVSHFAALFIVARTKRSIVKSCIRFTIKCCLYHSVLHNTRV